jgi:hypothetical protein
MFTLFGQSLSVSQSTYAVMKKDNEIILLKYDKTLCMDYKVKNEI